MKSYQGAHLEVTFDAARCLHAAECVRGLPAVFDAKARPWIQPDGAEPADLAAVVSRCPSGALHVIGVEEEPERPTQVWAVEGGPLFVRGDLRIATADGELTETRAALCRCGATANAPFCDASGACTSWRP